MLKSPPKLIYNIQHRPDPGDHAPVGAADTAQHRPAGPGGPEARRPPGRPRLPDRHDATDVLLQGGGQWGGECGSCCKGNDNHLLERRKFSFEENNKWNFLIHFSVVFLNQEQCLF